MPGSSATTFEPNYAAWVSAGDEILATIPQLPLPERLRLIERATLDPGVDSAEAPRVTFEREGWLLVPRLLNRAKLEALLAATGELERASAHFERDTHVRRVFFQMQSANGRKGEPAIFPGALRKITSPSSGQPAFDQLRRDPDVLAAVESCGLVAPQCLIDQVNLKLPRVGSGFPYHQDESFLFGDALRRVQQFGGVNLVIAIDPADAENGVSRSSVARTTAGSSKRVTTSRR